MALNALILTGYGINCEQESKYCIEKSGGHAEIVHLNTVLQNPKILEKYNMLMIPGGATFGDELGAGKVFANKMKYKIRDELDAFVKEGRLILGIGNGFQILVNVGLLPEPDFLQRTTLIANNSGKFEDRWVLLKTNKQSPCIFTKDMEGLICPVRHTEGKFIAKNNEILNILKQRNQIVFQYVDKKGELAAYPHNPNGSIENIAGICDPTGKIFGMMPHPEAFNVPENCPYWIKGTVKDALGLQIFRNAVKYFRNVDGKKIE